MNVVYFQIENRRSDVKIIRIYLCVININNDVCFREMLGVNDQVRFQIIRDIVIIISKRNTIISVDEIRQFHDDIS